MKTIVITGAATGIGLATAKKFAAKGFRVAMADVNIDTANERANEIEGEVRAFRIDVTNRVSVQNCYKAVLEWSGQLDILHANAGVSSMVRSENLTEEDWDFNFDVNAKGVFITNQEIIKYFLAQSKTGAIINTASLAAKVGAPFLAHYSASKFAVLGWTQAIAREYGDRGIRVNAVCPGFVKTAMQDREIEWEAELLGSTPEAVLKSYVDQTPLARLCKAEDVADAAYFLASDSSKFMTGQGINVTGGVYMG